MSKDWISTYTGQKFFPLDPNPEDVNIIDIAHALAHVCRYTAWKAGYTQRVEEDREAALKALHEIIHNPKNP